MIKGLRPYLVFPSASFLENIGISSFFSQAWRKLERDLAMKMKILNSYLKFGGMASGCQNRWACGLFPESRDTGNAGCRTGRATVSLALNELSPEWQFRNPESYAPETPGQNLSLSIEAIGINRGAFVPCSEPRNDKAQRSFQVFPCLSD